MLVPLFEQDGEARVWLLRRPDDMRRHGGQVAFPGGKSDPADESLLVTALREADEELGIARADVDVLGPLDDQTTGTSGFTISPWVGWLAPGVVLHPNPIEVARVFSVPLAAFLDPASRAVSPLDGWTIDGEWIWGATAAILRGFAAIATSVLARPSGVVDQ